MINLLPAELKEEYRYARRNRHLLRWVVAFVVGIVGVGIIAGAGVIYMNHSIDSYSHQIADTNSTLAAQDYTGVTKQITNISNDFKLVVQVLSKEVLFSKLLAQLGSVTPSNAILTNLAISQTQGGIDITAQTADYNAATQLQINLSDPNNQIFSKADIVSITCASAGSTSSINAKYPCAVTIRALFAPNNPFLFISNTPAGKAKS